jgi:hypothetical protein
MIQACRYLVKDFGTSRSPKSTRQRGGYCAAAALRAPRPAHSASHGSHNGSTAPGCVYRTFLGVAAKTPGAYRGLSSPAGNARRVARHRCRCHCTARYRHVESHRVGRPVTPACAPSVQRATLAAPPVWNRSSRPRTLAVGARVAAQVSRCRWSPGAVRAGRGAAGGPSRWSNRSAERRNR